MFSLCLLLLLRPNSLGEWNDHAGKRWLGKVYSDPTTLSKHNSVREEPGFLYFGRVGHVGSCLKMEAPPVVELVFFL